MYYYVMMTGDNIQYVASETPPEIDYQMLTEEEYIGIIDSIAENRNLSDA